MTEKLYYHDTRLREFTAHITARQETERGPAVCLDRTAFYPTSGGQPHDTGTLNEIPVLDVWADEAGEIWHLLAQTPDSASVSGQIAWERRFDHTQQHTGQHLLSAAFMHLCQGATFGFHMGRTTSTLDIALPHLSWETASQVEDEVNRVIWEDRAINARFVTAEELAQITLRRQPKVSGPIRVVSVAGGYDNTPCGGTHATRTGEVGLVKLTRIERYKGNVRVTFLCGGRALRDYRRALRTLQQLSRQLTVGQEELPDALARLQEEVKTTRHAWHETQSLLREAEAKGLWNTISPVNGVRYIPAYWPARPFAELQALAAQLQAYPKTFFILATTEEHGVRLICGRSDDLPDLDAVAILRAALAPLNGRGGGSPALARGGAPPAAQETILAAIQRALPVTHLLNNSGELGPVS